MNLQPRSKTQSVRRNNGFRKFVHQITPTRADITLAFPPFVKIVLQYRNRAR